MRPGMFRTVKGPTVTPYGLSLTVELDQLPKAYAWMASRFIEAFDKQLQVVAAAALFIKLVGIWPVDTGRSVRSWEQDVDRIPDANNPPGPRPRPSLNNVEALLSGKMHRAIQKIFTANQARMPGAGRDKATGRFTRRSSYVSLLWYGSSPQMGSAEPILEGYFRSIEKRLAKRAEKRTYDEVLG